MKGLLLKDFYMAKKHLRAWVFMMAAFIAVSCFNPETTFFVFYPCMLSGMVPVSLLGYDERGKWDVYAGTLPCSRAQQVSAKYLVGLMIHGAVLVLTAVGQGITMAATGVFHWSEYLALLGMLVILGLVSASMTLPFMFKYGVEKGRMAYYVMVAVVCGTSALMPQVLTPEIMQQQVSFNAVLSVAVLVVIGLYALSWWLSIRFYEKREMK